MTYDILYWPSVNIRPSE